MLPFGVTIPVTVPQRSEIPEGLMNYPVFLSLCTRFQMEVLTNTARNVPLLGTNFKECSIFFALRSLSILLYLITALLLLSQGCTLVLKAF